MSKPNLRVVRNDERPTEKDDEVGCVPCALVVMFIIAGLIWWPIFKYFGAL